MADPMPTARGAAAPDPAGVRRGRRTLILLAAVCIAPVVASYAAYYLFPHDAQTNYGTLLPTAPAPAIEGLRSDGAPFRLAQTRGKWVLLVAIDGRCEAACERLLYATRQARTMQGREQERIVRVLLVAQDNAPEGALLAAHPGLAVAQVDAAGRALLPGGLPAAYLVDPLGNLVLRYGPDPDIKGVGRDLSRLLKASRIG